MFDFGGVLITPITNQVGEVAERHGVPMATMLEILLGPHASGDHPWHRAERGEMAVAGIQAELQPWADPFGVTLDGDELDALMRVGGYDKVAPMIAKVAALKAAGVATGLLTNTFAEYRPTLERELCLDDFTVVVESYAVRARKPEPAIYEATREMLGVAHEDIVYLDDFPQNIIAADAFGWRTIHVTEPLAAIAAIDGFL